MIPIALVALVLHILHSGTRKFDIHANLVQWPKRAVSALKLALLEGKRQPQLSHVT